jgi:hypothetical protein
MPWLILGASVIGAGAGIYASDKASDASKSGANRAIEEQRRQYDSALRMLDPSRALGYGATSDLATLFGYKLPAYTSANELISGAGGGYAGGTGAGGSDKYGQGLIKVGGRAVKGDKGLAGLGGGLSNSLGLGQGHSKKYGGYIDPITGKVVVDGNAAKSAMLTEYLRTGQGPNGGKKLARLTKAIDSLRASGWQYDPNAAAEQEAAANLNPAAPGSAANPGGTMTAGGPGGDPVPPAGNMSRFMASPDYNFRMGEANKAVERSAAARTGALNPNTSRALLETSGNLASGEYGNYVNRLLAMAGMGQASTTTAVGAGANSANNISGYQQARGDANASGIMGAANSITGAIGGGLNSYLMMEYLKRRPTGGP